MRALFAVAVPSALATAASGAIVQNLSVNLTGNPVTNSAVAQATYGSGNGWMFWAWDNGYSSYQGTDPLQSVTLRVAVDVGGATAPRTFGARIRFFTGWSPNHTQFSTAVPSFTTDSAGHWEQTWTFTGAQVTSWFQPPYGPNGSMYGEMFAADAAFNAVMSAELTFNTVPAPGAVALLGAFAAAARPRRRR
jgi:hypothetical protein